MKIAVLSRHRRLLVLCACSTAVHLALLALVAAHGAWPSARASADTGLSVRLMPAPVAVPARPAAPVTSAPAPRPAPAPASPAPRPTPAATSAPAPTPAQRSAQTPADNAAALSALPAQPAPPTVAPPTAAPAAAATPLMQMPGRYHVRLPAPALLTYDVVRQPAGGAAAPAGTAHLSWRTDGDRYLLDLDGPLGRLHSEGASGDAGIAPRRAREETDGGALVTEFDADGHRVLFRAAGTESPDNVGIQDRASLLMQLAGIGLAAPDQLAESVDIVVAGARDLRVARFRVLGQEDVTTAAGTVNAWHLAELAAPGVARLDVWLAPERGWMPVRLRMDDGAASVTQTLRAVGPAPAPP